MLMDLLLTQMGRADALDRKCSTPGQTRREAFAPAA